MIGLVEITYESVAAKAEKLRLAIRYADNSLRVLPPSMMARDAFDGISDDFALITRKMKVALAGLDALLDEMEQG